MHKHIHIYICICMPGPELPWTLGIGPPFKVANLPQLHPFALQIGARVAMHGRRGLAVPYDMDRGILKLY